jgi:hypothetical protein
VVTTVGRIAPGRRQQADRAEAKDGKGYGSLVHERHLDGSVRDW